MRADESQEIAEFLWLRSAWEGIVERDECDERERVERERRYHALVRTEGGLHLPSLRWSACYHESGPPTLPVIGAGGYDLIYWALDEDHPSGDALMPLCGACAGGSLAGALLVRYVELADGYDEEQRCEECDRVLVADETTRRCPECESVNVVPNRALSVATDAYVNGRYTAIDLDAYTCQNPACGITFHE